VALDFPNSPNDGQVVSGFTWDNTAGLWRVRGNALSPAGVSSVTGTVATTTDGNDTIYSFTDDGTITIATGGIANILLVGGGGGGGLGFGGGGGGGGLLYLTDTYLPAGSFTVTVGAGGPFGPRSVGGASQYGQNGGMSRVGPYTVLGGGGGGSQLYELPNWDSGPGLIGGCGGGTSGNNTNGNETATGLGLLGGNGGAGNYIGGAGGGGMGADGQEGDNALGANGGDGVQNSITGSAVYYAGGGAGYGYAYTSQGTGGLGGGGDCVGSGYTGTGLPGTANTGGGGAGANALDAGAGGSGIVIVRILG
tara:strand:+ start:294 stop:1217 length:924 start_codon:yes stop_codon:yes gene_type:complete